MLDVKSLPVVQHALGSMSVPSQSKQREPILKVWSGWLDTTMLYSGIPDLTLRIA